VKKSGGENESEGVGEKLKILKFLRHNNSFRKMMWIFNYHVNGFARFFFQKSPNSSGIKNLASTKV
jgi:hypothetical protein